MVCFCCREEDGEEELEVSENEQEEEELEEALAKAHEEEKKLNKRSALLSLCASVWGGWGVVLQCGEVGGLCFSAVSYTHLTLPTMAVV